MNYCPKCKKIDFSDNSTCSCGKKYQTITDYTQPVKLLAADDVNKGIIEQTLEKENIPYSQQAVSRITPIMGVENGNYVYYVPISFLKKAIDALVGISAMELPDYYDKLDLPDEPEWEEMSPTKRRIVKVLSVVGFMVIVYLCMAVVDIIAALVSSR